MTIHCCCWLRPALALPRWKTSPVPPASTDETDLRPSAVDSTSWPVVSGGGGLDRHGRGRQRRPDDRAGRRPAPRRCVVVLGVGGVVLSGVAARIGGRPRANIDPRRRRRIRRRRRCWLRRRVRTSSVSWPVAGGTLLPAARCCPARSSSCRRDRPPGIGHRSELDDAGHLEGVERL